MAISLNDWIEPNKDEEIKELKEEIRKLKEEKDELERQIKHQHEFRLMEYHTP